MKKQLACIISGLLLIAGTGCGGGGFGGTEEGDLSVMVYAAGYGMDWVEEAIRVYNEDHPEVKVVSDGDPLAFETIKTQLENGTCSYDVVLVSTSDYNSFVAGGYLEPLDDLYDSLIPGEEKTVRDVVAPQITELRTINGSIYGVPWQQNNPSGLIYNVEMFRRYGWDQDLPETMDELWELCERIDKDTGGRVAPITFGGADGKGYLSWNFCQWLCEYYGYDAMIDFLELESPDAFAVQAEGRKKVYETLAKLTMGKMSSGRNISLEGSVGATAITAQTNFVNGKAAMTICGQWFPTEMQPYTDLTQFESGFLPMPHINPDKKSGDGTIDTSDVRFSTDGNLMAIPATAKNKDLAKDFLLYMFTQKSYTSFVEANNGLLRPVVGLTADITGFDMFTKSAYDYFSMDGNAKTVYQVSPKGVMENGTLAMFLAYRGDFFSQITSQATYEAALKVAEGCVANEMSAVYERWDAAANDWR